LSLTRRTRRDRMMGPFSSFLAVILDLKASLPKNPEVDLQELCDFLARSFGNEQRIAARLLQAGGVVRLQELVAWIVSTAQHDSAVRDMVTSGHLAKVLSRRRYCERSVDFNILGLPNRLFDERSTRERTEYLAKAGAFSNVLTKDSVNLARQILSEERKLMCS
jgi:hypothetical protein